MGRFYRDADDDNYEDYDTEADLLGKHNAAAAGN